MSQVKILLLSFVLVASFNATADVMSGFLDLSNLYGKTDAGKYFIGLALNTHANAIVEVTQKLSAPPYEDQPGSEPQVCLTEIRVNAGQLNFVLTDSKNNEAYNITKAMDLYSGYYDETETCTPIETLLSVPVSFMPYFNLGSIYLSYKAPKDYDYLVTAISVFPYGYDVALNVSRNADNNFEIKNLKSQLSSQVKRGNKEALSHYTYAERDQTTLSLGQGFIELK